MVKPTAQGAAQPPDLVLGALDAGSSDDLYNGADLDGVEFANLGAAPIALRDARILGCRFSVVASADVDVCGAGVSETEFERPDFVAVRAWRGRWRDVRLRGGRVGVIEAYDSEWRGVEIEGCKISYLNLRNTEATDLILRDCQVDDLDLSEAVLRRVAFTGSRIGHLNLRDADMQGVDLRGATYDELSGVTSMRGTIVTHTQLLELAPLLAKEFGIAIAD